jgi:hypothetical protein
MGKTILKPLDILLGLAIKYIKWIYSSEEKSEKTIYKIKNN